MFDKCFTALRGKNGSYILNGPLSLSPSGTYKVAGTSLTYQRGDRTRMESIVATGPLNESLALEVKEMSLFVHKHDKQCKTLLNKNIIIFCLNYAEKICSEAFMKTWSKCSKTLKNSPFFKCMCMCVFLNATQKYETVITRERLKNGQFFLSVIFHFSKHIYSRSSVRTFLFEI